MFSITTLVSVNFPFGTEGCYHYKKQKMICVILAMKSCGFRSRRRVLSRSRGRFDMLLEAGLE